MGRIRPESVEPGTINFRGRQPSDISGLSDFHEYKNDSPVAAHSTGFDEWKEMHDKVESDYQARKQQSDAEEAGSANISAAKAEQAQADQQGRREYSHGTSNAKRGKAKLHKNELVVSGTKAGTKVRRVKKTGVQTLKGHEQIIPAAPQSRWNVLGESGAEQQSRLLGW